MTTQDGYDWPTPHPVAPQPIVPSPASDDLARRVAQQREERSTYDAVAHAEAYPGF